jgi:hypothetical protein
MKYSTLPKDTTLDTEKAQLAVLKKIGVDGRFRMTMELSDNIRDITMSGIRQRNPEYSEDMVKKTIIRYMHGEHLYKEIFSNNIDSR